MERDIVNGDGWEFFAKSSPRTNFGRCLRCDKRDGEARLSSTKSKPEVSYFSEIEYGGKINLSTGEWRQK